ncbi:MAG TPA: hypothetical protein DD740_10260 [Chryseobacterium sp.]|nr:hypothetical protein [Chryseobacterium sp.]
MDKASILRKKANKKRQRVRAEGTVGAPAPKKQSDCPQTGPKVLLIGASAASANEEHRRDTPKKINSVLK